MASFFMKYVFGTYIPEDTAQSYIAGMILLGVAPCTAMVFVWSYLSEDVLKKLKEKFGLSVLGQIVEHSNAYLVHSNDGKTIITMGKYLSQ